jgi:hypothetical protein
LGQVARPAFCRPLLLLALVSPALPLVLPVLPLVPPVFCPLWERALPRQPEAAAV